MIDYIRDGTEIYTKSFATIRAEADLSRLPPDLESVAVRLIHSCGMIDIVTDLAASPGAATAGHNALAAGAPILCDARMVAEGITHKRLPADNAVICTLWHSEIPELARQIGNTRSPRPWIYGWTTCRVRLWRSAMPRLLCSDYWKCWMPEHQTGFNSGFPGRICGGRRSKAELAANSRGVPFITLHGRRGGSAMATAAVNALAKKDEL